MESELSILTQETTREDLRETLEQLIQAGVQRDRHALRIQQLTASRPATAEGAAGPGELGGDEAASGSDGQTDVIEQHLTRQASASANAHSFLVSIA